MKKSFADKHRPSSSKTYGNSLARTGAPRSRLLEADWERAPCAVFLRFPQAFGRKSFFQAISSGFRPKKFFSSDFLRLSAEKVFFKRFPQAFSRKSFFQAISSGNRKKSCRRRGNQFPSIGRTLLFIDIRNAPRQPELPANKKTEIPYVELTLNRSLDDD